MTTGSGAPAFLHFADGQPTARSWLTGPPGNLQIRAHFRGFEVLDNPRSGQAAPLV